jgi:phospholipase C
MAPKMDAGPAISRRALLGTAAGGAAMLAGRGLPAWARPIVEAGSHLRKPDSLPFPHLPAGHPSMDKIEHIVVLMLENHSFDGMLGMVPWDLPGRRHSVDGLTKRHGMITNFNRDAQGNKVYAQRAATECQLHGEPSQSWNASHEAWDNGRNDGFVKASAPIAMRFWGQPDLPFTYSLAKYFPMGNRYFCSVLAQTYPNRRFFFSGTASGTIATDTATFTIPAANGTIWERLDQHRINWGVYYQQVPSLVIIPGSVTQANKNRLHHYAQFLTDAAAGKLPSFTFLDPNYSTTSEENPQDVQVGEDFVAQVVHALMKAPTWKSTALFITYDEHGGYYDHVPPPPAIKPDNIKPMTSPGDAPGGYNRYGFRVPTFVVSPHAKPNYVSNVVQDHTSITAFIERKWNLPAMTFRDANAHPMTDYFDFKHAAYAKPPHLAKGPALGPGVAKCHAQGYNPPLPPGVASDHSQVARLLENEFRRLRR